MNFMVVWLAKKLPLLDEGKPKIKIGRRMKIEDNIFKQKKKKKEENFTLIGYFN